jgi:hypothetical protein
MSTETSQVVIPDEVASRVNAARDAGKPITLAYVAPDGFPVVSLRGSVHVHGPGQLALWVRHADGDLIRAIRVNPKVSLLYRDNDDRTTLVFSGLARVTDDAAERNRIFDESPTGERDHDPERTGAAVVIDLRYLEGGSVGPSGSRFHHHDGAADTRVWSRLYPAT